MSILLSVLALALAAQRAGDVETLAQPLNRRAPAYPEACMPPPGEPAEPQTVVVIFGVSKEGLPENVRARESTDPCFEEAAIAAVRSWEYEPRRVNAIPRAQTDLEATFIFEMEAPTLLQDTDARPVFRVPPHYPETCQRSADNIETVLVEFDVLEDGTTGNIRVVESSRKCFEKAATQSVAKWRYVPKIIAGKPAVRRGVQTSIIFQLDEFTDPDYIVRNAVRLELERVRRSLGDNRDPSVALKKLAEIDLKYGPTFSNSELSAFHHVRASARVEAGDYRGAVDDLRVVLRLGRMQGESGGTIAAAIVQLEAAIAAQEDPSLPGEPAPADADPPQE